MAEGYVKIFRDLMAHELWTGEPFTKGQAWVDLILQVNHKERTMIDGLEVINIERGAIITSTKKLAERWKWSRHKVTNFLDLLEGLRMIEQKRDTKRTYLKLLQYGTWQDEALQKGQQKDTTGTAHGQQKDTNNKGNNVKKDKHTGSVAAAKTPPPPAAKADMLKQRQYRFYTALVPYVEGYGKDMVRAFFNYWSEPNKGRTKMRWEDERHWDLARRLENWRRNEDKWAKPAHHQKEDVSQHDQATEDLLQLVNKKRG